MKTLKKGSTGADVKTLQQDLKNLGYNIIADGIFGNGTQATVILFQHDHNLSADGIAGPNTWAVITDLLGARPVVGIDVSHYDGVINWNLVPQNQVSFVFCKATQGKTYRDEMMQTNMTELKRLNFIRGVYHFLTFKDVSATAQVNNFLNAGIDFSEAGTLPPVLDVEWQQSDSLNQYIINNKSACVKKIKNWLDGVENKTGRTPVIYTNSNFWEEYLGNPSGFENYPLWIASYRSDAPALPAGWNNYTFWQNTETGSVTGITGQLDKNIFNGTMNNLQTLALM